MSSAVRVRPVAVCVFVPSGHGPGAVLAQGVGCVVFLNQAGRHGSVLIEVVPGSADLLPAGRRLAALQIVPLVAEGALPAIRGVLQRHGRARFAHDLHVAGRIRPGSDHAVRVRIALGVHVVHDLARIPDLGILTVDPVFAVVGPVHFISADVAVPIIVGRVSHAVGGLFVEVQNTICTVIPVLPIALSVVLGPGIVGSVGVVVFAVRSLLVQVVALAVILQLAVDPVILHIVPVIVVPVCARPGHVAVLVHALAIGIGAVLIVVGLELAGQRAVPAAVGLGLGLCDLPINVEITRLYISNLAVSVRGGRLLVVIRDLMRILVGVGTDQLVLRVIVAGDVAVFHVSILMISGDVVGIGGLRTFVSPVSVIIGVLVSDFFSVRVHIDRIRVITVFAAVHLMEGCVNQLAFVVVVECSAICNSVVIILIFVTADHFTLVVVINIRFFRGIPDRVDDTITIVVIFPDGITFFSSFGSGFGCHFHILVILNRIIMTILVLTHFYKSEELAGTLGQRDIFFFSGLIVPAIFRLGYQPAPGAVLILDPVVADFLAVGILINTGRRILPQVIDVLVRIHQLTVVIVVLLRLCNEVRSALPAGIRFRPGTQRSILIVADGNGLGDARVVRRGSGGGLHHIGAAPVGLAGGGVLILAALRGQQAVLVIALAAGDLGICAAGGLCPGSAQVAAVGCSGDLAAVPAVSRIGFITDFFAFRVSVNHIPDISGIQAASGIAIAAIITIAAIVGNAIRLRLGLGLTDINQLTLAVVVLLGIDAQILILVISGFSFPAVQHAAAVAVPGARGSGLLCFRVIGAGVLIAQMVVLVVVFRTSVNRIAVHIPRIRSNECQFAVLILPLRGISTASVFLLSGFAQRG